MVKDNLSLFLVDDDIDDQTIFLEALSELNLISQVKVFDNGVDLMADLLDPNSSLPDIIYLDLNMPMMNGEECLQDIRNEPSLAKLLVVIYSGFFDEAKIKLLKEIGANGFLRKPSSYNKLKVLLERSILSVTNSVYDGTF